MHGRKRVLLTDTLGFARLVKVAAADTHDGAAGYQLLHKLEQQPRLLPEVRKICADGGFRVSAASPAMTSVFPLPVKLSSTPP